MHSGCSRGFLSDMELIDAHNHVNFNAYKDDADNVIQRSLDAGVGMFAVGSQSSTSERAVAYAEKYDGVWAVIGLHPIHLFETDIDEAEVRFKSREESFDADFYRALAKSSTKVVAIGECGIDYYHVPDGLDMETFKSVQGDAFRSQIDLALELDLPVMVHCRDAHGDLADTLDEFRTAGKDVRGQIHCFTGTVAEAKRYLDIGMYISFTGIITFAPKKAEIEKGETLLDVVKAVPLDRIIVETDAPYLAPAPHRGKWPNQPEWVRHVAERVAELKGVPYEEVASATLENTKRLYGLDS